MKTYNRLYIKGKEIFYRVYGYRYGKKLEVHEPGTGGNKYYTVDFSFWNFDPIKEVKRLVKCLKWI